MITLPSNWNRKAERIGALVVKESWQVLRDPSSIAIGVVLPVLLILIFGYGLSLDVKNVPIAIVLEDNSPAARDVMSGFELSQYFRPYILFDMPSAINLMLKEDVNAIARVQHDFSRRLQSGQAEIQLLIHGTDANRARIIQAYAQGAIAQWGARRAAEGYAPGGAGPVVLRVRQWFNEANDSRYFLVPGLIVLVMTLIGAFLTALVVAREWERGTFESLFVTPVQSSEILLSKIIPYFILGVAGFVLCLLAARFMFHVPLRGSYLLLFFTSMLYLLVALGIGLFVSATVRSQFVASQLVLLITFLPATLLSGFIFDIRSMPAFVRAFTYILPARYYVSLVQTIFLAGDVWLVILPNALVLALMAALLLNMARRSLRKELE